MEELINWPVPWSGTGYRDSGEGGLCAFLVYPYPEGEWKYDNRPENCHVDTWAYMPWPDVFIGGAKKDEFWSGEYNWESDEPFDHFSKACLAVIFLGSTNNALFSDDAGEYFIATEYHLTPAGKAVKQNLDIVYDQEGKILTFLDT
jgi:hypothetical protein